MRAVIQRVSRASVRVDGVVAGEIGAGLLVLLGVASGDEESEVARLAEKVARLRVFENDDGRFDRSVLDTGGAILVVSQFTLIADTPRATGGASEERRSRGRRSACTSASARSSATSASRWRRASSALEWTSSSSTTGR